MSEINDKHFCWNELLTSDSQKAKAFYQALLGWEAYDIKTDETTYTIFKKDDRDICGMMQISQKMKDTCPANWLSYIKVSDIELVTEKAQTLGASIIISLRKIPGYGIFSVLQDPTGATFAFWQKEKT